MEEAYGGHAGNNLDRSIHSRISLIASGGDEESDERPDSEEPEPLAYEGEEQLATVTVVENFNIEDLSDSGGPSRHHQIHSPDKTVSAKGKEKVKTHRLQKQPKLGDSKKIKKRRVDFHYSSKGERLLERAKQLTKHKRGDDEMPKKRFTRRRVK